MFVYGGALLLCLFELVLIWCLGSCAGVVACVYDSFGLVACRFGCFAYVCCGFGG